MYNTLSKLPLKACSWHKIVLISIEAQFVSDELDILRIHFRVHPCHIYSYHFVKKTLQWNEKAKRICMMSHLQLQTWMLLCRLTGNNNRLFISSETATNYCQPTYGKLIFGYPGLPEIALVNLYASVADAHAVLFNCLRLDKWLLFRRDRCQKHLLGWKHLNSK